MKRRRGDVAFYGLLAAASILAAAFALWNHGRDSAPRHDSEGRATAATASDASVRRDPLDDRAAHIGARRKRTLEIRASRGPSWIAVRAGSSRGPILFQGILERGGSIEERGTAFWTQVGAVENVDVRVDRRVVRLGKWALGGIVLGPGAADPKPQTQPGGVVGS